MKKTTLIILATIFFPYQSEAKTYAGIPFPYRVVDGDTISTKERPRTYYRLLGYDSPESYLPRCDLEALAAGKATTYFTQLLQSPNIIFLETSKLDKYGRKLIRIWANGTEISTLMIKANLGVKSDGKTKFNWCRYLRNQAKS